MMMIYDYSSYIIADLCWLLFYPGPLGNAGGKVRNIAYNILYDMYIMMKHIIQVKVST